MGQWKWEGVDEKGKRLSGKIDASSQKDVRKLLRLQGVRPKKIIAPSIFDTDLSQIMVNAGLVPPFGAKELCYFTKQLGIMIDAGVPLLQALDILHSQEKQVSLKTAVRNISTSVGEGKTLAEAMSKEKGFTKLYCNLIKAGEVGGILNQILDKLTIHLEKQEKTKAQIKSAMTYPLIVSIVGIAVVYGLMVFVVPQFESMLKENGQKLPWITQFVMDLSKFFQKWGMLIVPGIIAAFFIFKSFIKTPSVKPTFDFIFMKVPVFGTVIIKGNLSSFARTLSTLLSAGLSIVDALEICVETIDNEVISKDIMKVRKAVMQGKTFYDPISKIPYFPSMVAQMIKVGESTGNTDQMLSKVSDVFEEEVNQAVSTMTKMIEPLVLVVLGGMVAVVLIAMYLPIFMSASGVAE